jgi:hypothetical protein
MPFFLSSKLDLEAASYQIARLLHQFHFTRQTTLHRIPIPVYVHFRRLAYYPKFAEVKK